MALHFTEEELKSRRDKVVTELQAKRVGRPADIPAGKYVLPDRIRHHRVFAISMPVPWRGRAAHTC